MKQLLIALIAFGTISVAYANNQGAQNSVSGGMEVKAIGTVHFDANSNVQPVSGYPGYVGTFSTSFTCPASYTGNLAVSGMDYTSQLNSNFSEGVYTVYRFSASPSCQQQNGTSTFNCNIQVIFQTTFNSYQNGLQICSLFGGNTTASCTQSSTPINKGVVNLNYMSYCNPPI